MDFFLHVKEERERQLSNALFYIAKIKFVKKLVTPDSFWIKCFRTLAK